MKNRDVRHLLLASASLVLLLAGCPSQGSNAPDGGNLVPPIRDLSAVDLGDGGLDGGDGGSDGGIKRDLDLIPPVRDLRKD